MNNNNLEQRQSQVIEAMRFLLILLVLFIHVLPETYIPLTWRPSEMNVYHLVSELISHNWAAMAVPCFFLFSGFFFFYKKEVLTVSFYFNQWWKRIYTLLIPYFVWNILLILAIFFKNTIFLRFGLASDDGYKMLHDNSLFALLWGIPVNYPLWYLRDLIVVSMLAPVFRFFFKYTGIYGLVLLSLIYFGGFDTNIPGFSITAIFFFGVGVFLATFKKNILVICSEWRLFTTMGAFLFLCCSTYYNGTSYHLLLSRLFIPFGIVVAINFVDWMMHYAKPRCLLCQLSSTVFFIYSIHEIYIINWLKGIFYRTSLADSGWGMMLCYVLIPFITLVICLILYFILSKTVPHLLSLLVGGRGNNQCFNKGREMA